MSVPASDLRYTRPAIALHWVLAAGLVAAFLVGLTVSDMPVTPKRVRWINYHKWAGITLLALSCLRLLWRVSHRPPALPQPMPTWQRRAYGLTHGLLYLCFFAVPLAGWAYSSADGFHVVYLGWVQLPDIAPRDKALAELLKAAHETLAWTLAALVGLHVLAALKHHFFDRDGLLWRMSWHRPRATTR